jgi:hypothetical protein
MKEIELTEEAADIVEREAERRGEESGEWLSKILEQLYSKHSYPYGRGIDQIVKTAAKLKRFREEDRIETAARWIQWLYPVLYDLDYERMSAVFQEEETGETSDGTKVTVTPIELPNPFEKNAVEESAET